MKTQKVRIEVRKIDTGDLVRFFDFAIQVSQADFDAMGAALAPGVYVTNDPGTMALFTQQCSDMDGVDLKNLTAVAVLQ